MGARHLAKEAIRQEVRLTRNLVRTTWGQSRVGDKTGDEISAGSVEWIPVDRYRSKHTGGGRKERRASHM